jgi:multidrug efflux pump
VQLTRYNGYPAVSISGEPAPATARARPWPRSSAWSRSCRRRGLEWTGLSLQERLSGSQAPMLMALSLLVVFLCLAALYESWSIPTAVLLVVPLGVLGAVLAVTLRGMPNDVFFKVGLITMIGLSAKNAILIIEFAKDLVDQGVDATDAADPGRPPAPAADRDDLAGVHPRRGAAGHRQRRQLGQPAGDRHRGDRRHAQRNLAVVFVPVFFVVVMRLAGRDPGHQVASQ